MSPFSLAKFSAALCGHLSSTKPFGLDVPRTQTYPSGWQAKHALLHPCVAIAATGGMPASSCDLPHLVAFVLILWVYRKVFSVLATEVVHHCLATVPKFEEARCM